jgi:superfamily II DNA or RNA helicase
MASLDSRLEWLRLLRPDRLATLLGQRTLDVALASELHYVVPPRVWDGSVQATLGADPRTRRDGVRVDAFSVAIELVLGGDSLRGSCSRCMQSFGPCPHTAVLAVDLACSVELRDALRSGGDARSGALRAPAVRRGAHLERTFESALDEWLRPTATGRAVEIAATLERVDGLVRYAFGNRIDPRSARAVAVSVRRRGERKLCAARDLLPRSQFHAKDRKVLEHVRDVGTGRKAALAVGVDASLALEAMRVHGGILAAGFKRRLDFRPERVRPGLHLAARTVDGAEGADVAYEELSLVWLTESDGRIAADDTAFFPGPFPFVWSADGAIFPVASGVDLELTSELAARPVLRVPAGRVAAVGARLFRATRGRGVSMPAREAFGLPSLEPVRFVLRLHGEPLDLEGELAAVYGAREIVLAGGAARETGDGPAGDARDRDAEDRAVAAVRRAGLLEGAVDADPGARAHECERVAAADEAAVLFWQNGLVDLRAETDPPFEIVLTEALARVRVGAPLESRVRVALEGNWLDTRLEFSSGELGVELDAVREALARKRRWVRLSDGSLSRISASIAALAEESAGVLGGKGAALLPAHQLGRIDRWIEENDGRVDAAVEALRGRLRALAVSAEPVMPVGLEATLRGYQRRGLAWLQFLGELGAGGILADDMGLGKTITTLAYLLQQKETHGPAPSLVVCPTSVAGNWVREAARFTPSLDVVLLHGDAKKRDHRLIARADIVVTTYALLRRDLAKLEPQPFRAVVLDEAQNIKNADAATTRAAGRLQTTMRLALSGTPMENRLAELWSLASFANPGMLGTLRAFETRFERPIVADAKSPIATELRALVRPFLLRRTKDEVLSELPPKTEIDRYVTLRQADKRMYDALAHALRASVAQDLKARGAQSSLSVFTALTRLRQMACDPRLVDPRCPAESSAKREAFLELVKDLVLEGRRALVFSQFVQLLTLWRADLDAAGIAYEYLDGSTVKRDEVVTRFQEGHAPLFLVSLKAGGAGLNLTAADTVIHCDPWWNPAVEDQATDRTHRIGQDKPVTVIRLVARGTIEEKILALKQKKRELASAVIGDEAGALAGLTQADIRRLLGDGDAADEDDAPSAIATPPGDGSKLTDSLATTAAVVSPDYYEVVADVRRWLATTGRLASDLAALVDLPPEYAARLALGQPFPCSRAVARRIRERIENW